MGLCMIATSESSTHQKAFVPAKREDPKSAKERLAGMLSEEVFKAISRVVGDYEVISSIETPKGLGFTLRSTKHGLVHLLVMGRDKVRLSKVSPVSANQLVIDGRKAFVDYLDRVKEHFDKEGYKKVSLSLVYSEAERSPEYSRVARALYLLNFRPRGNIMPSVAIPEKSPAGSFARLVAKKERLPITHVYYGYLPNGMSVFLVHESSSLGRMALAELFIPSGSERPKVRFLESRKSALAERVDTILVLLESDDGHREDALEEG